MKVIMYHYVREGSNQQPYFRYLHVDKFERQLDWLGERYGFVDKDMFNQAIAKGTPPTGVVLTFDDGFVDHYRYVLPVLEKKQLWGIFYIPTRVYSDGCLLDVHRIHRILGAVGGYRARVILETLLEEHMLSKEGRDYFSRRTYLNQIDDADETEFKRVLNYYIDSRYREKIVDLLFREVLGDEEAVAKSFYLKREEIRELHRRGMVIGGHSVSHQVLSKLSPEEQQREIHGCLAELAEIIDEPVTTFCYPFGGPGTYTDVTKSILSDCGVSTCFAVEPRDVEKGDLIKRRFDLPRYDCNVFPFGKASQGV